MSDLFLKKKSKWVDYFSKKKNTPDVYSFAVGGGLKRGIIGIESHFRIYAADKHLKIVHAEGANHSFECIMEIFDEIGTVLMENQIKMEYIKKESKKQFFFFKFI